MASCSQWNCTSAIYKEILDGKIKESLPMEIDQSSGRDFCHLKKMTRSNTDETDSRTPDTGNDSASTAPRSTVSFWRCWWNHDSLLYKMSLFLQMTCGKINCLVHWVCADCQSEFSRMFDSPIERVTGRKARVLQMEEIDCKCQTFLSLLSGRRKQTSNIFFSSL